MSSVEEQDAKEETQCLTQMFVALEGLSAPSPEEVAHQVRAVFTAAGDGDYKLGHEEIVATLVSFYKNASLSRSHKRVKKDVNKYLESHDMGTHIDLCEFFKMLFEPEFNLILSAECRTAALALLQNDVVEEDQGRGALEKHVVKREAHASQCLTQLFVAARGSEPTPEEVYNEVKAVFEEAGDGDNKLGEAEIVATLVSFYKNARVSRSHKKVKANVNKYLESHDMGTHIDLCEFFKMLFEPEFNLKLSAECRTAALALLQNDVDEDERDRNDQQLIEYGRVLQDSRGLLESSSRQLAAAQHRAALAEQQAEALKFDADTCDQRTTSITNVMRDTATLLQQSAQELADTRRRAAKLEMEAAASKKAEVEAKQKQERQEEELLLATTLLQASSDELTTVRNRVSLLEEEEAERWQAVESAELQASAAEQQQKQAAEEVFEAQAMMDMMIEIEATNKRAEAAEKEARILREGLKEMGDDLSDLQQCAMTLGLDLRAAVCSAERHVLRT